MNHGEGYAYGGWTTPYQIQATVIGKKLLAEMTDFAEYESDYQIRIAENAGLLTSFTMRSNAQLKSVVTA